MEMTLWKLKFTFNSKGSVVDDLYNMYRYYRLTQEQIFFIEHFIFEPSNQQAIALLKKSPKVWGIIKYFLNAETIYGLDESVIINGIATMIEKEELGGRYFRSIAVRRDLQDFAEKIIQTNKASKLKTYIKQHKMKETLKRY